MLECGSNKGNTHNGPELLVVLVLSVSVELAVAIARLMAGDGHFEPKLLPHCVTSQSVHQLASSTLAAGGFTTCMSLSAHLASDAPVNAFVSVLHASPSSPHRSG
jgi:hypothetical protein